MDEANYNDINFWTSGTQKNLSSDELAEILGELSIKYNTS